MVDEKIICLWIIDEIWGYLCWNPLIMQSNHKLSEKWWSLGYICEQFACSPVSSLPAPLQAHSILAALVSPDLPMTVKHKSDGNTPKNSTV